MVACGFEFSFGAGFLCSTFIVPPYLLGNLYLAMDRHLVQVVPCPPVPNCKVVKNNNTRYHRTRRGTDECMVHIYLEIYTP